MEPTKKIIELIREFSKVSYFYILRMNISKMKNLKQNKNKKHATFKVKQAKYIIYML